MPNKKIPMGLKVLLGFVIVVLATFFSLKYVFRIPQYQSAPESGRNLSSDIEVADKEFVDRVNKVFPKGTPGEKIKQELLRQGFRVQLLKGAWRADFTKPGFPCETEWLVIWRNRTDGIAEDLLSIRHNVCL
jgi:hypothetical protein